MKKTIFFGGFYFLTQLVCQISLAQNSPASFVNPFIGTAPANVTHAVPGGMSGATHPGAVVPFGMVQLGPDTNRPERSGYSDLDKAIRDFSFTHMSGPGCPNMGEFPFMPFTGETITWPEPTATTFDHKNQSATAGYYRVQLDNKTIVELTATERTGFVRLTFPQAKIGEKVGVLLNTNFNAVGPTTGIMTQRNESQFHGSMNGGGFCWTSVKRTGYQIYFAMDFNKKSVLRTMRQGLGQITFINDGQPLLMKVGLSLVSKEGARLNLNKENPNFDFNKIKNQAFQKWHKALSTIEVDPRTSQDRKVIFYTALYHSLLHPNVSSDVNGQYMGFDKKVHVDPTRPFYANFSGWDVYRSEVQLLAFLFPQRAADIANSLVKAGSQCGAMPKWSVNNAEVNIMVGDPASLIVSSINAFGVKNFDRTTALNLMRTSALDPQSACQGMPTRSGSADYLNLGYLPHSKHKLGSASIALELYSADDAISKFAEEMGDVSLAKITREHSRNWRKIWNDDVKMIRARDQQGWLSPFDPGAMAGFVEGNSAQYSWMIPFELKSVVEKIGGDKATVERLDQFMSQKNAGQKTPYLYIGNEPCFVAPWVYLWAHAPHRTQKVVRDIMFEEFSAGSNGLAGNDDLGALSSWYVWSAIGLYPAIPARSGVVIGSPTFDSIKITPEGSSKSLKIHATRASSEEYVAGVIVGQKPWTSTWLPLADLLNTGEIHFEMKSTPQLWGSFPGDEPPSE